MTTNYKKKVKVNTGFKIENH